MSQRSAAALLLALVVLAYGNSLGNGFVFDDLPLISHNRSISDFRRLPGLFLRDYWAASQDLHEGAVSPQSGLYRPLVIAGYSLNAVAGGLQPFGFHLVNVILHALVSCLLYFVALQRGMNATAALVAAALFAIHPIHTEAVTAIIGRAELMMSAGALAYFWFAGAGKLRPSCLALAFALFSKEQGLVLPLVLLISEWTRPKERDWRRYAAYGLILAWYLVFRWIALGGFSLPPVDPLVNPAATAGTWVRVWTAIEVAGMYLWLMVWPAALSANYSFDSIPLAHSPLDPAVAASAVVWLCLLGLAVRGFARGARIVPFSVGLTFLTFLPVSNLLLPIGTIMGERLFYLPSAGLCLLAGMGIEYLLRRASSLPNAFLWRGAVMASLLVAGTALVLRTAVRNQDWADNEQVALSMLKVVPNNAMAHALLGYTRKMQDTPETRTQALQAYETALRIYPEYVRLDPVFASHYGQLQFLAGRPLNAVRIFQDALTTHRQWSTMHYNLGLAYTKVGRIAEAEKELREARTLNPADADTYNVLSHVLLQQGRFAEALAAAEEALRYAPRHEGAQYYRALAMEGLAAQAATQGGQPAP